MSEPNPNNDPSRSREHDGDSLQSWKEIAVYLQREPRTVMRWEKEEALPVHRHQHSGRSTVYAYPSELDAWRAARKPKATESGPPQPRRRFVPALVGGLALAALAAAILRGPILNPPDPLAEAAGSGIIVRQVWADEDSDQHGSPAPDGTILSYTDWETGNLAIRDLKTGENRHLTSDGTWGDSVQYAYFSVISPAGDKVAYSACCVGRWGHYDLRVVAVPKGVEAAQPRVLFSNEEVPYLQPVGWSADGEQILAILGRKDRTSQIVFVSVADGTVRTLKTLDWRWPQGYVSPDGKYFAYDFPPREDSNDRDIFVLATDGSRETTLVERPGEEYMLGWAPDDGGVLFASNRTGSIGAWLIPVEDGRPQGAPQLVRRNIGRVRGLGLTHSGEFYYGIGTGMRDVYVAALDPSTGKVIESPRLADGRLVGANSSPAWSPDGRYLAYLSRPGSFRVARGRGTLVIQSMETGDVRELTPALDFVPRLHLRWSPDGGSILATGSDDKGRSGIFQINVETGDVIPRVRGPFRPQGVWSADGKSIYYTSNTWPAEKVSEIRVKDLETGEERSLYGKDIYPIGNLALSPDGRWLAFGRGDLMADTLYVMPANGGAPRTVLEIDETAELGGISGTEWSRDGRYLLYSRDGKPNPELWRVSAEGGTPQRLGLKGDRSGSIRAHPDGKRIAYVAGDSLKTEVWVMENFLPEVRAAK